MNKKKILFAVGGTGGHLFPAIALAHELESRFPQMKLLFAGGGIKHDSLFSHESFNYYKIKSATVNLRKPLQCIKNIFHLGSGLRESLIFLKEKSPDLVVGFGSYYSLPLLIAAKICRIPYVLHEQNIIPGRVTRLFSKGAKFTAIHYPDAAFHLKGKTVEVTMPLKTHSKKPLPTKSEARNYYSIQENIPAILCFGGSQGAQKINQLFSSIAKDISNRFHVLHFTGDSVNQEQLKESYASLGVKASVKPFEDKMEFAWQAADFCVTRAGACSIAEQIAFEVPGILIPYPSAQDNHQEKNADYFVNAVGGGVKVLQSPRAETELKEQMVSFFCPERRFQMQQKIKEYKINRDHHCLANLIIDTLENKG